jgi:hypothetical protein
MLHRGLKWYPLGLDHHPCILFPKALRTRSDSVAFAERVEEMITAVSTRNKTNPTRAGRIDRRQIKMNYSKADAGDGQSPPPSPTPV